VRADRPTRGPTLATHPVWAADRGEFELRIGDHGEVLLRGSQCDARATSTSGGHRGGPWTNLNALGCTPVEPSKASIPAAISSQINPRLKTMYICGRLATFSPAEIEQVLAPGLGRCGWTCAGDRAPDEPTREVGGRFWLNAGPRLRASTKTT